MEILCVYCGDLFEASPRHKNQIACKKPACQRARKAEWQRREMRTDPAYNAYQKISQKEWARANPDYWKQYRLNIPKKRRETGSSRSSATERPDQRKPG